MNIEQKVKRIKDTFQEYRSLKVSIKGMEAFIENEKKLGNKTDTTLVDNMKRRLLRLENTLNKLPEL